MPFHYLWLHVCMCMHVCAHVYVYMSICLCVCTCMCGRCACMICVHAWMYVYVCVWGHHMCVSTQICMHANAYTHLYKYTCEGQRITSGIVPYMSLDWDRDPSFCCFILRLTSLWHSQVSSSFASHLSLGMLGFQTHPAILGFWGCEFRSLCFHGNILLSK